MEILAQWAQSDEMLITFPSFLNPLLAETYAIGRQSKPCRLVARRPSFVFCVDVYPLLTSLQHVVLGDREKVVTVILVPLRDHFRKISAIGPQRMRVQVALEPAVRLRTAGRIRRLRDHGRAKLVGTKTYGKGTVQTFFDLEDGAGLKLTTARFYTP